jgi:hypothetical protein
MTADPILTLAWLILAHLVADFVLQTNGVVAAKTARGTRAVRGFVDHAAGVAVCLVPVALAFGGPGLMVLVTIVLSHVIIDRLKIVTTRRTEAAALAESRRQREGAAPAAGLGRAWTPAPAAWFILDQLAHLAVIWLAWAIWLAGTAPTAGWATAVGLVTAGSDPTVVHEAILAFVVVVALLIANVRGGAIFVATLVRPLEVGDELIGHVADGESDAAGAGGSSGAGTRRGGPSAGPVAAAGPVPAAGHGWSIRIGPLTGRVVADPPPATDPAGGGQVSGGRVASPPPARVGATIGVLERLLIVTFVLVGAESAIGLVVAAKTIARFRQLDDRDFAEYYLLGTLASVSVAIVTALVARAALNA